MNPPAIPDHTLLRPIGRGAYGEVWLARNVMGVLRAVKVIERRQFDSSRPYEREFVGIQRYEPVSRLTDGLVHVLHVGCNEAEGYFYYVMELADATEVDPKAEVRNPNETRSAKAEEAAAKGEAIRTSDLYSPRTLRSELKRQHRLSTAECLRVALDVVNGLAKLHEQGLVHRDVKPGNIIFVNGRAKLADVGLVSTHSEGRTFVGTEGYIPPEGPGSPVADIYALGMALYEAATGHPPEEFPKVPPEWFAEDAGTEAIEFHEIVLKACEGAKERRYPSAERMRADLALLQSGQSVRKVRQLERRAMRTQRLAWAAVLVVAGALAAVLVANWRARVAEQMRQKESTLLRQAQDARGKESDARARAESAERDARQQLGAALFEQAKALVLSRELGHRTRALEALRRATDATNKAEMRRVAFAALTLPDLRLQREISLDPALTLAQPDPAFERIALARGTGAVVVCSLRESRDSRRLDFQALEAGGRNQVAGSEQSLFAQTDPVRGLSVPTSPAHLEILATLPASTNRSAFVGVWSADGRFLAVKRQHDADGVRSDWEVWDVGRTQRVLTLGPDVARSSVMFHPQRPWFIAGHGGGQVTEWDVETGRQLRTFRFPNTPHVLVYSPDGQRLAASYRRGAKWCVAFHDSTSLDVLCSVEWPESMELLAWHPQGRWVSGVGLIASAWARGVHLIDPDTGQVTTLGENKIKTALSAFTADGNYLVSGGWDREIICWDLQSLQRAFTYAGPGYRNFWSADGRRCLVVLPDGVAQLYAFERPGHRNLTDNPGDALRAGQFSPDGRWLVARDDRHLCLWDLSGDTPTAVVPVPRGASAFFLPDSTELFAVPDEFSHQGYLGRWRLASGTNAVAPPQVEPLPARFSSGFIRAAVTGNELAVTSAEGVRFVALTNLASGEGRVERIPGGLGYTSPDARWLAMTYEYSPLVRVYRLPAVEEVAQLHTSNLVTSITYAPAGDEMLVINRGGVEWFDTATWQRTRRLPGAPVSGSYAFYTPDGNGIWLVTHFRNAALLDRRTLEPLLPLPNNVVPLALSPDGRQLAVSVKGRQVQLWNMDTLRGELATLGLDW